MISRVLLLIVISMSHVVFAEPLVLYDSGDTKLLAPLIARVKPSTQYPQQSPVPIAKHGYRFPIQSQNMRLGRVTPRPLPSIDRRIPKSAMRPLFLFGSDPQSLRWVKTNWQKLKQLNAIGMLVEAKTQADWQAAKQVVSDIPMFAGSAEDIGRALNIKHYPVLITPDGITQ